VREGKLRTTDFLAQIAVREIGPDGLRGFEVWEWSFISLNTPEELEAARKLLRSGPISK
jgi:molybdopterin-guanine dinucleotide biosynthesis protein A